MEKIKINEEKLVQISTMISKLVSLFSKNDHIDCMYMNQIIEENKPMIQLVLIGMNNFNIEGFPKIKSNIRLSINHFTNYDIMMLDNESIKACRELYQSKILFDKTGYYRELQKELGYSKIARTQLESTFEFEPPLKIKL